MNDRETERQKKSEFRFKISKQILCSFAASIYSPMHKSKSLNLKMYLMLQCSQWDMEQLEQQIVTRYRK